MSRLIHKSLPKGAHHGQHLGLLAERQRFSGVVIRIREFGRVRWPHPKRHEREAVLTDRPAAGGSRSKCLGHERSRACRGTSLAISISLTPF